MEASVGGALCVEKYNGATEIDYFTDTVVQAAEIFTVAAGKKDYTYGDKPETSVRFLLSTSLFHSVTMVLQCFLTLPLLSIDYQTTFIRIGNSRC